MVNLDWTLGNQSQENRIKSCIHLYLTPNCQWKTLYQIHVPSFRRNSVKEHYYYIEHRVPI